MTYDEAKAEALDLHPARVAARRVYELANRQVAEAGFVNWDAQAPSGADYVQHKQTFIEAVYLSLSFVSGACRDEWVVLGRYGTVVMRSLENFIEEKSVACWPTPLSFIGTLSKTVLVYVSHELPGNEWLAGAILPEITPKLLCCRGLISNCPVSYGNEQNQENANGFFERPIGPEEPLGERMWRAMQGDLLEPPRMLPLLNAV